MEQLKKSFALLMLLTLIIGSRTFAQDFSLAAMLKLITYARTMEVIQDNEYTETGFEEENFFNNPLLLNGKPLNYFDFTVESKGELTVIKGAAKTGKTMRVPFYLYLRRDGNKNFCSRKRKTRSKADEEDQPLGGFKICKAR